jgi:hypothetical protein
MMYREKLMLVGFGLGSANRSIRQARTADRNSADRSIFSCYEGRLTSSFSRRPMPCRDIDLSKLKIPTGYVSDCLRRSAERAWVRKGSKMFGCVRRILCAQISKMSAFPSYALGCYTALVCSFQMNRSRDIQPSHDGEQCGSLQS